VLHKTKRSKFSMIGDILCRELLSKALCIIKRYSMREDKEEDISSYCMILKKREDNGN
jgi:hypothetical protein